MKAIIIGGGIGGMALAVALRQQSIEAEVYEQADELREVGAGLVLWPNALKALDTLGLVPAIRAVSVPFRESEIKTWQGELLTRLTSSELQDAHTGGELIHRTQLLKVFADCLNPADVRLGCCCASFEQNQSGVTTRFRNGQSANGDLLIGADGIHSVVRHQLFGDVSMPYAGYVVWRGITDIDIHQPVGTESWGKGMRFGCRTTTQGRTYWYATANMPAHQPDNPNGRRAELLARFHDWHTPIPAILQATEEAHILRSDIANVAPLKQWSVGRVTLLGDAAHALTPNLGQGACQAIEDAVTLARLLKHSASIEAALQTYQERRMRRVYAVANRARRLGEVGQWENPLARTLRNFAVKHHPDALQQRQMRWLFHFDPDTST